MNRHLRILFQLAGLLLSGGALLAADNTVSIIALSDITAQGQGSPRATPSNPVYYFPHTTGFRHSGATIDGVTPPPQPDVEVMLVKALASQGYIYHILAHKPASIILVFEWGYLAPQIGLDGSLHNKEDMNSLVEGLIPVDPNDTNLRSEHLIAATKVPRFYLTITALDFKSLSEKKHNTLWCTRVSTQIQDASLAQVLPALIRAATPLLGTQTSAPRDVEEPVAAGD